VSGLGPDPLGSPREGREGNVGGLTEGEQASVLDPQDFLEIAATGGKQ